MTSPLERAILTHYHCSPGPYKDGSEHWTQLECEIINEFIAKGLLIQKEEGNRKWIEGNSTALPLYMDALSAVPFPVLQWVIPLTNRGEQG